jgi:hypothetical protein
MTINVLTQFPDELSKNVDQTKINQLLQEANYEATNCFFEHFDPQKSDVTSLQNATETMGLVLTDRVTSDVWIEALCGQDIAGNQRGALRLYLKSILTAPTVPSPAHLQAMPQTKALCIAAALGALLGVLFGELVGGINEGFEPLIRTIVDCALGIIGAALGVYVTVAIVKNEKLQKWALPVIGGFAALDTLLQTLPVKRFIPFLSFKSYVTRMMLYGVLGLVAFVACRAIKRDFPNYRREIELVNEQWLHHAKTITLVLLQKLKEPDEVSSAPHNEDTSVLQKIIRTVQKLQQSQPEDVPIVITELVQDLEAAGLTVQPTDEQLYQELDWDESLREQYTVIGIPRQGRRVKVVTLPIIRGGKVEKKGELRLLK